MRQPIGLLALALTLVTLSACFTDDTPACEVDADCYEGAVCLDDQCIPFEFAPDGTVIGQGGNGGDVAFGGSGGFSGGEGGTGGAAGGADGGTGGVAGGTGGGAGGDPDMGAPVGGAGGRPLTECEETCSQVVECALQMPDLCGGVAEDPGPFLDTCLPTCEGNPALHAVVDPDNCEGTLRTLINVSADVAEQCESPGLDGLFPAECQVPDGEFRSMLLTMQPEDPDVPPLYFELIMDATGEGEWLLSPVATTRQFVAGPLYIYPVAVIEFFGGQFFLNSGPITVPADANPYFDGDLELVMEMEGSACAPGALCGQFFADSGSPFAFGSFGSIEVQAESDLINVSPISTCRR